MLSMVLRYNSVVMVCSYNSDGQMSLPLVVIDGFAELPLELLHYVRQDFYVRLKLNLTSQQRYFECQDL